MQTLLIEGVLTFAFILLGIGVLIYLHNKELL